MAPTLFSLFVATLFGVADARVCRNESGFMGHNILKIPAPENIMCQEWKDKFFGHDRASLDECMEPLNITLDGIKGDIHLAAWQLQKYMTHWCCTGPMNDFPCKDHIGQSPCQPWSNYMTVEDDGYCTTCAEGVMDGKCRKCWELDPEGCQSAAECSEYGMWDESTKRCLRCNRLVLDECSRQEDCQRFGGNLIWRGDGKAECRRCDMSKGEVEGCDQKMCEAAQAENFSSHWMCDMGEHENCGCRLCCGTGATGDCKSGGSYRNCPEPKCTPTADKPDIKWATWEERSHDAAGTEKVIQRGECKRCYSADGRYETDGCLDRGECQKASGTWRCHEDSGPHCCGVCVPGQFWGCQDGASCQANGGNWCHGHGGGSCERTCMPDPTPVPCVMLSKAKVHRLMELKIQPRWVPLESCKGHR